MLKKESKMKYFYPIVMIFFIIGCGSETKQKSISTLSTFKDSTSYALGADLGSNLKQQGVEIDYDVFMAGITDAMLDGDLVKLDQKQRRSVMASLQQSIRDKAKEEGETNLLKADEFLDKNKADNSDVKETPTGLQYRVLREGDGDSPVAEDRVKVHYAGKLIDGTEFDSSYERGDPTEFGLNQVIKGWTEGLQLMKVGAKYEFFIHPNIAYGARPRPTIPANSVLIFEVELLDIVTKK
ncbi:MAG: FKBP-type peptidyl-prolyl cis-trans isomerase [Flavobacteriaceae bacterium TMED206]|nr:MAG: FKBP-type peptidyl-prolyl cis-trans isomerase [Flavobacteriaceae bacterium TMED206]|tara:strand:- start:4 stop:720 length:717 start_codon:yes stop_codon:yes gene_type:complete